MISGVWSQERTFSFDWSWNFGLKDLADSGMVTAKNFLNVYISFETITALMDAWFGGGSLRSGAKLHA